MVATTVCHHELRYVLTILSSMSTYLIYKIRHEYEYELVPGHLLSMSKY